MLQRTKLLVFLAVLILPLVAVVSAQQVLLSTALDDSNSVFFPIAGTGAGALINTTPANDFVPGNTGNGIRIDAANEFVRFQETDGITQNVNLSKGTLDFWYKPFYNNTDGISHRILSIGGSTQLGSISLYKRTSAYGNDVYVEIRDSAGKYRSITVPSSAYSWLSGQWINIRITWDSTTTAQAVHVYLNGTEPRYSSNLTGPFPMPAASSLQYIYIGAISPTETMTATGVLDTFMIYNGVVVPQPPDRTPPVVVITSPVSNSVVNGTVVVSVSATDNAAVDHVELYKDGIIIGNTTAFPYQFLWDTLGETNSIHTLLARAVDTSGNAGFSGSVSVIVNNVAPDTTPPFAVITDPANGSTVNGTVLVNVSASDNAAVSYVELYKDGIFFANGTAAPYQFLWNSQLDINGLHVLEARAVDTSGNAGLSQTVNVDVENLLDTTPPQMFNGTPTGFLPAGTTSTTIGLNTDENANCKYDTASNILYNFMAFIFSSTGGTVHSTIVSGLSDNNTYSYFVKCQDLLGNADTSDLLISFSVAADTTAPNVTITYPVSGSTVSGTINVNVTAIDDVAVAYTELYKDGLLFGNSTSTPYVFVWNTLNDTNSTHTLVANAVDTSGNAALSQLVNVIVNNSAPQQPPVMSNGTPVGMLPFGTTSAIISLNTDENASCKYDLSPGIPYSSMAFTFSTTGGMSHSTTVSGLSNGGTYNYFVKCIDGSGNADPSDLLISFSIAQFSNFGRPSSDVITGWTGTPAPHWSNLNEVVPNDTTVIRTGFSVGVQTDEIKLSSVQAPPVKTGHILRVRALKDGAGNALTYQLVQGTTVIASATHSLPDWPSWATNNFTLTTAQASQITNYSDLRVRLTGNAVLHRIFVSWIEFEVPNSTQPPADTTPPSVSITLPVSGSTLSATSFITASASDNVGVVGVQFYIDGVASGPEYTFSPYVLALNTTSLPSCAHNVTAVARDLSNNYATSAPAVFYVDNSNRPNIVFILTDDQRWDTMQYMPLTSALLSPETVKFSNAFVTTPDCCPSRTSILTGLYSHNTGVLQDYNQNGGAPAFNSTSTFATWLRDTGYRTGIYGKYLNSYYSISPAVPPGWNEFHVFVKNTITNGDSDYYYNYQFNDNGVTTNYGNSSQNYSTSVLLAKAIKFINSTPASQPLLLYFTPYGPHDPATPYVSDMGLFANITPWRPPSFNELDVSDKPNAIRNTPLFNQTNIATVDTFRQRQLETLQSEDRAVSSIIASLQQTGRWNNTLIILMSDNGLLWGEHRIINSKFVVYEESVRVPLWVRAPGLAPHNDNNIVAGIDVAPTLAEWAGVIPPTKVNGRSMISLLNNSNATWRNELLLEYLGPTINSNLRFQAVRTPQYVYNELFTGERELYDLQNDPYELNNSINDTAYAQVIPGLQSLLNTLKNS